MLGRLRDGEDLFKERLALSALVVAFGASQTVA